MLKFFESQLSPAIAQLESSQAKSDREHVLSLLAIPRDPVDEQISLPLFICRHVVCSESTSWTGFLPPMIRNKPVHAYDPLPPTTAISTYDQSYFNGLPTRGRGQGGQVQGGGGILGETLGRLNELMEQHPDGWQERIAAVWRELTAGRAFAEVPQQERDDMLQQVRLTLIKTELCADIKLLQLGAQPGQNGENRGMPGAFPGQDPEEDD